MFIFYVGPEGARSWRSPSLPPLCQHPPGAAELTSCSRSSSGALLTPFRCRRHCLRYRGGGLTELHILFVLADIGLRS